MVNFTLILHDVRLKLNLSMNQYCVLDSIDSLSKSAKYDFWCIASKKQIGDFLGISEKTVQRHIKELEAMGLIEKNGSKIRATDVFTELKNLHKGGEFKKEKGVLENKIPNLKEVVDYFKENGYSEDGAKKMFNFYNSGHKDSWHYWRDSRGNSIKNWKRKAQQVWFKPENEDNQQPINEWEL